MTEQRETDRTGLAASAARHRAIAETYQSRADAEPDGARREFYIGIAMIYLTLARDLDLARDVASRLDEKARVVQTRFPNRPREEMALTAHESTEPQRPTDDSVTASQKDPVVD
jgi:hypothetical protein